jgi:hypothetical protein
MYNKRSLNQLFARTVPGYEQIKKWVWRPLAIGRRGPRALRPEMAELMPHLADYRAMFEVFWLPYVMNCTYPNVRSPTVNTDGYGFRYTIGRDGHRWSPENQHSEPVSIMLGASVAFGVGSTSDATTVPSLLAIDRGEAWFNMSMRGFTFAQNLIQTLFFLPRIGKVERFVLFGGINDINQFFLATVFPRIYGSFYEWMQYFSTLNPQFSTMKSGQFAIPDELRLYLTKIDDPNKDRSVFEDSLRNVLASWKLMADGKGVKLYFVLEPVDQWMKRDRPPEEERLMARKKKSKLEFEQRVADAYQSWYGEFLRRTCKDLSIPYMDMNERFGAESAPPQWLFMDNVHLTNVGAAEAARLIDGMLRSA